MSLKISVITPSFNQAEFLPRTIVSIERQSLKPIEHLIFDPGSSDGSREIAAKASGVTLIAEEDEGQADAVARGMLAAKGDIIAWLNSDDEYYDEGVFAAVAEAFASEEKPDIVFGDGVYVDQHDEFLRDAYVIANPDELPWRLAKEVGILQPATFISKALVDRIGPVDRDLHFCMDYEFWIRAQQSGAKFMRLNRRLAKARYYPDNKTLSLRGDSLREVIRMLKKRFGFVHYQWVQSLADFDLNKHDGILQRFSADGGAEKDFERHALNLNRLINGDVKSLEHFRKPPSPKSIGKTLELLEQSGGYHAGHYAKPIAAEEDAPAGVQTYVVGPTRWGFKQSWLKPELARSDALMELLGANRKSDTCVIVGNGPSLNHVNMDDLKNADVFITNYAFLNKKLAAIAQYLCVTNYLVAEQEPESFNLLADKIKFTPYWLSHCLLPAKSTCYIRSVGHAEFGDDFRKNISWRSTVSFFAMQIAYALGYRKVLLTGFDHSYVQPESTEGDLIDQDEDDPNHFDPRYFKGKVWQAADTDNMEAMYRLAKAAFEKDGREIVNCTVGGHLEIFRRGDLAEELGPNEKQRSSDVKALIDNLQSPAFLPVSRPVAVAQKKPAATHSDGSYPRLLLIDHTRTGNGTATGELKATLFADWPRAKLLQLFQASPKKIGVWENNRATVIDAEDRNAVKALHDRIAAFQPDAILYRPVPNTKVLHKFAMEMIPALNKPLATWIMDDWPAHLSDAGAKPDPALEDDFKRLLAQSQTRLCIGEAMGKAFEDRYGAPFVSYANGVDPADWPKAAIREGRGPVRVRYAGSLASNMTLMTLQRIGQAVEDLSHDGVDIVFEIKTRDLWRDGAAPHFEGLTCSKFIVTDLTPAGYREWLSESDIVVIGYNFDETSTNYVKYSVANKLPECLACGAALFAVGPEEVATMALLEEIDCGARVMKDDLALIKAKLADLARSAELRFQLAEKAQSTAAERFNIHVIRDGFRNEIAMTAASLNLADAPRDAHLHVDETAVVARMLESRHGQEHVMIDVGGHYGESAAYFDALGWRIFCFEPDPQNREKLMARFGGAQNVEIDPRAVSDKAASGAAFFTSEESTGISGLSSFHKTHKETARVDITTVADVVAHKKLKHIDFLKIDVEGFDLSVLKGVPWDHLKPDVVECEFEDAKTIPLGHKWQDIADYLKERGYAVYVSEWHPIVRYGVRHDWRRAAAYGPALSIPDDAWGNLLAFRKDPGLDAVRAAFASAMLNPEGSVKKTAAGASQIKRPAYAAFGEKLRARSPKAFAVLHLARRSLAAAWRLRALTAPALLLLAALAGAGFLPGLSAYRMEIWTLAGFAGLAILVLFIALRLYRIAQRLSAEVVALHDRAAAMQNRHDKHAEVLKHELKTITDQTTQSRHDLAALQKSSERLTQKLDSAETFSAETRKLAYMRAIEIGRVEDRAAAAERQIGLMRYPNAPHCFVLFGHHKCGSRFFRNQVFGRIAEATEARVRKYEIRNRPFHYSSSDDLDLKNMDFGGLGHNGRDVVLFSNATAHSLDKINENASDWKGLRILRDPRQVLVSNYFHHKGDHLADASDTHGWVWDSLVRDKPVLRNLPEEDGLIYELDHISKEIIETQVLAGMGDERILTLRLEDFAAEPAVWLRRISDFLEVPDIAGLNLDAKGANPDSGAWRNHFTPRLTAIFKERYGKALIDLGYEKNLDW
ncbi:FkbM family methyltransferase [Hyphococcus sp.]|uniref:FkbM family methyltransferase n=1 Tax=Hyphococcus sp. TaxID=2038636 RepID=UPI0035C67EEC